MSGALQKRAFRRATSQHAVVRQTAVSCVGQPHISARLPLAQASIAWRCACYVIWRDGTRTQVSAEARLRAAYWGQCGWTTLG